MEKIISIEPGHARKGILMARAANPQHEVRNKILSLLKEKGRMTVTEIYTHKVFRKKDGRYLDQSVASQHLAILRRAGLVQTERQGKFIHYTLNKDKYIAALGFLADLGDLYGK